MKINFKKGMSLVEVVVAVFVFSVILSSLVIASNLYLSGAGDSLKNTQGAYLAEEGIEALKIIRDTGWVNFTAISTSTTPNHYLYFNTASSTWKYTDTATTSGAFIRKFNIADEKRDSITGDVSTTGVYDQYTKQVTVSVSWLSKTGTTTKSLSSYITNIIGN